MSQYIVIPRITVSGANAQSAWWLVSGPSPLAWVGLVRKLSRDMGVKDCHKINVAILHHDLEMRGEIFYGDLHPYQLNRAAALTTSKNGTSNDYSSKGLKLSMGLQPVALCNLTATLVIEGLDDVSVEDLTRRLMQSRLAGGTITGCGRIKSLEWGAILSAIGNGFFLKSRSDLLENISAIDRMDKFIKELHDSKSGDKTERKWMVPMNLGYLPITPFCPTPSARNNLPHAYAEPLVGLVEYLSKRALQPDELADLFWGYHQEGAAFVVKHV